MSTVIVCGGRDFDRGSIVEAALFTLNRERPITRLAEGGARGADQLARTWARLLPVACLATYRANWSGIGRQAGIVRNAEMLRDELAHGPVRCLLAFPGGRGTADMIARAKKAGVLVLRIVVDGDTFQIVRDSE